ncbi:hypothetical protein L249_2839 [Ophiocordyceps polyrhachis-furcata BCC 54312]|uniref:DUF6314 domain-containing protein n=1 Tax=Ophiocordyceps polyrhachis-furcata BCC 54312 TaxID=1330021 RepID=A0A367LRZ1_9HYPO|nr:hypothetical protein L249_2839 [Ophiocordyceps polyrhachis-furcata BCC 54312]
MAKSVCVVGAGPSGLVAAKTFLHNAPKGAFHVTVLDRQSAVGGLWPSSVSDRHRQIDPLMLVNQSRYTMHFSDLAWETDAPPVPRAFQVGKYLHRYLERYLTPHPAFQLRLDTSLVRAEPSRGSWELLLEAGGKREVVAFDYLLVASGHFGKPMTLPEALSPPQSVPIIHSCQYRDLESLLGSRPPADGKVLVVGGQMSGVEIAGTIAAHISSAANSPETTIAGIEGYSVHHIVQRPSWVFPIFTTPEPEAAAPPFLPLDFSQYNFNNRSQPLANTQGHIGRDAAQAVHAYFHGSLGGDQSTFSPLLRVDDEARTEPPYLVVSDWYCDFVRSGLITLSRGKLRSLQGSTATVSPDGSEVHKVAAVVLANGFDPSPSLSFLADDILRKLHHSPRHPGQPLALSFHGTHHPQVPGLGFVGFYRSPYWGVMQMQARFLAEFWSEPGTPPEPLLRKLAIDDSVDHTLALRDDARVSQFPMGDYPWLMQEFAEALSIQPEAASLEGLPPLPHNGLPLDMLTPSRYLSPTDDGPARDEAAISVRNTVDAAAISLSSPKFVARAVFRSLLGGWNLQRRLVSKLPSHPSGYFNGTAKFLLREATSDGTCCAGNGATQTAPNPTPDDEAPRSSSSSDDSNVGPAMEYLYVEDGEFKTDTGLAFRASRRYVWRYDEQRDVLSTWFARTDDPARADYLFHEMEFQPRHDRDDDSWKATAGHLCVDDYYDVKYSFAFKAVNLCDWSIEYTVKGPKKDYSIHGTYSREARQAEEKAIQ